MPTIVGVKLRNAAKPLFFDPNGTEPAEGDHVVVCTERGAEFGEVVKGPREVPVKELPADLKSVERVATDEDVQRAEELRAKEREIMPTYRKLVEKHRLDMKPIDVEYLFDGDKLVFYFVAEDRVDFRDLVRDLAAEFHARIDMRQVGVRDEARIVGGLGHCGETLCCVRFGGEFQPVSIRMAKEQDLPLNPQKISGSCGRLMCCLRYEYDAYKDFKGRAPKRNAIVETPKGLAKVVELNTPKEQITLRLEDGERLTVPLSGMDCAKGGEGCNCPCRVKPEALPEEHDPMAGFDFEPRATTPSAAPPTAPETTTAEPPKTRRRRRGGGGGGQGQPKDAATTEQQPKQKQAPKPAQGQGQRPPKQAPKPAAKASGEAPTAPSEDGAAKPAGARRRRRRRPGKPSGEAQ